ncbi:MAG: ribonuclease R [Oleiphilaceae bacterium]|jgi:ribonuclease R
MLKLDTLNQLNQLKTNIKASRNIENGTVKGSAHKFGFVTLDSGKDVYLPPDEMQKVLPGDRIEVEIIKDAKKKKMAKIERLLESPTNVFCGKYVTKGKTHFVEPDIPGLSRWLFVPPQKRKNAKAQDLVKCRITQHPFKTGNAQASVIELLGNDKVIGIERSYVCSKYDISTKWNDQVEAQLETLNEAVIDAKKSDRDDLSDLPFITIDAASTVDMDDALYATKNDQGWVLSVAIADPCALIEADSAIEKSALLRATSIYFPGQPVPMLPEKLAGDLCSLVAGKDRLVKVINVQVMPDGALGEYQLSNAVIRSRQKLSYTDVSAYIANDDASNNDVQIDDAVKPSLACLQAVSDALLQWREKHLLTQQNRTEFSISLDESQKIASITERPTTLAHKIVEESMVAANRCIAELLAQSGQDSLFITHNGVRSDRLDPVQKIINEQVAACENSDLSELNDFVKVMSTVSGSEALKPVHLVMTRQLEKSRQTSNPAPHFGMGLKQYTTFTSPLRKANDYLIHRQLSSLKDGKPTASIDAIELEKLALKLQNARGAVFDVEQWLKCQFMVKDTDVHQASVLRAFSTGFQVRLLANGIEGFVSTKEMEGKYSFNQDQLSLTGKVLSFKLDQIIEVQVKQIDWSRKQIQFELAGQLSAEVAVSENIVVEETKTEA